MHLENNQVTELNTIPSIMRHRRWRFAVLNSLSTDMYIWVTKGQGRIFTNGESRGFGPNTLLCIPKKSVFSFSISANAQGFFVFTNRPDNMSRTGAMQLSAQSIFDQGQVTGYFDSINKELASPQLGSARAIESFLNLLDVWIDRNVHQEPLKKPAKTSAAIKQFQKFVNLLETNYAKQHPVKWYSDILDVTTTHLARICQIVSNKSTLELIQDRLVLQAKIRLSDSDDKINTISHDLGFTSPAYFSRFFGKSTGTSPRHFRKSNQKNNS